MTSAVSRRSIGIMTSLMVRSPCVIHLASLWIYMALTVLVDFVVDRMDHHAGDDEFSKMLKFDLC